MPTLLPRWFTGMASIINIPILRPSLYGHEVGNHIKFTRLHLGSLALRPISLSFRNSRPLIAQTPLLRTTKAYGQLLGRDFNPPAKLLLLRTSVPYYFQYFQNALIPSGSEVINNLIQRADIWVHYFFMLRTKFFLQYGSDHI